MARLYQSAVVTVLRAGVDPQLPLVVDAFGGELHTRGCPLVDGPRLPTLASRVAVAVQRNRVTMDGWDLCLTCGADLEPRLRAVATLASALRDPSGSLDSLESGLATSTATIDDYAAARSLVLLRREFDPRLDPTGATPAQQALPSLPADLAGALAARQAEREPRYRAARAALLGRLPGRTVWEEGKDPHWVLVLNLPGQLGGASMSSIPGWSLMQLLLRAIPLAWTAGHDALVQAPGAAVVDEPALRQHALVLGPVAPGDGPDLAPVLARLYGSGLPATLPAGELLNLARDVAAPAVAG